MIVIKYAIRQQNQLYYRLDPFTYSSFHCIQITLVLMEQVGYFIIYIIQKMDNQNLECEDCGMIFETSQDIARHKNKFCVNSKYGNAELLKSQFDKLSQTKDISLLGKNVKRSQFEPGSSSIRQQFNGPQADVDRQYRMLLRQIGQREDLKNKLERQKQKAEEQLLNLQEKEKDIVVEAKRKDLIDVIKKRDQLSKEEETLQKEIKNFQREKRQEQKNLANQPNEDFVYRQGREAGKLAMQRRLLQQKKRDLQSNLKAKKREQQRIQKQLGNLNEIPIYIPQYKIKQTPPPKTIYSPNPQRKQPTVEPQRQSFQAPIQQAKKPNKNDRLATLQPQSTIKPYINPVSPPPQPEYNYAMPAAKKSNVSYISEVKQQESLLRASRFAGKQKTLFESLNPKGKSDEDIFIESLVAQQYDALNLLARIPKDSELYQVKLKQFQEMSKVRQDLKDKIQMVRLQKVKRQFQLDKQMTETQKANLQWLDQNRKQMLAKGVDIIHKKAINHSRDINGNNNEVQPNHLNPSFKNVPNQFFNNNNNNPKNNGLTSFNNIPNSIQREPAQLGLRGHRVTVKYVRGYENKAPLSVKLIILQDGEIKPKSVFTTKYHDSYAPKDERNPYNPGMKNRKDDFGNIVYDQTFEIYEDLQSLYNNNQNQIYLWAMLMEKSQQKLSNEPTVYAWYCFKLTHFGQIREGTFTLNLYYDNFPFPNPTDMNRIKGKAQQEIVIELSDSLLSNQPKPKEKPLQKPQPPNLNQTPSQQPTLQRTNVSKKSNQFSLSNQNRGATSSSRRRMTMKIKGQNSSAVKNIDQVFFHQNQVQANFTPVTSSKMSFNIAIVGMRTLPSFIGPVKIEASLIDLSGDVILKQETLSDLEGDMYNPNINYALKITNQDVPSSTILLIRIIALNVFNYQPGLLGFVYFHLFYNENGEPIESEGDKKSFLVNGEFQLPVYWGNSDKYLRKQALKLLYPRIPCTSMLVSVRGGGEKVDFPPYSTDKYNTTFFDLSEMEYLLFVQQSKRESPDTREYIKAYFKFKGVSSSDQEQLRKLLGQSLAFKTENIINLHILSNMAEYNPNFGIIFAVDMLIIPTSKTNYYYFCSLCLSPPATYYKDGQNDLIFLYKIDLATSNTSELVLADDLLSFSPPYSQNTSIIIQLLRIEVSENGGAKSNVQSCSHTIVPLFNLEAQSICVNVGERQLRMENDQFDVKTIKRAQKELKDYLEEVKGKQKSQFSIRYRIMNGYFSNQLATPRTEGKGKPLRSIFQNSKGFKNTQQSVRKIIESTYGVKIQ